MNIIHQTSRAAEAVHGQMATAAEQMIDAADAVRLILYGQKLDSLGLDRHTTFEGSAEMAFIHFLGENAFFAKNYRPLDEFVQGLDEARQADEPTPVLLVNFGHPTLSARPNPGNGSCTSLALVEPGEPIFRSVYDRDEAGTRSETTQETAALTTRTLGLRAQVVTVRADIAHARHALNPDEEIFVEDMLYLHHKRDTDPLPEGAEGLVLHQENNRLEARQPRLHVAAGWDGIRKLLNSLILNQRFPLPEDGGNSGFGPRDNSPAYQLDYFRALALADGLNAGTDVLTRVTEVVESLEPTLAS